LVTVDAVVAQGTDSSAVHHLSRITSNSGPVPPANTGAGAVQCSLDLYCCRPSCALPTFAPIFKRLEKIQIQAWTQHRSLVLSSNTNSGRRRSQNASSSSSSPPTSPPSPFAPASASVSESCRKLPCRRFLCLATAIFRPFEYPHYMCLIHRIRTHTNNTHAHTRVHVHLHVQSQPQRSALPRYSPPPLSTTSPASRSDAFLTLTGAIRSGTSESFPLHIFFHIAWW
jgi:hypothetical protein